MPFIHFAYNFHETPYLNKEIYIDNISQSWDKTQHHKTDESADHVES